MKKWQYNGAAPFDDIVAWCRQHFGPSGWGWSNSCETIFFDDLNMYSMFILRWS